MRSRLLHSSLLSVTLAFLAFGQKQSPSGPTASAIMPIPELARSVSPSVVLITTRDQNDNGLAQGTGFVVAPDGLVATNLHVVEGASSASVRLANGDIFDTVFVADVDRRKDLALIKIKALDLRPAKLGDSESMQIGQHVVAVGNPSGLAGSVSDGILSAIRRIEGMKLFQITAPISPGSSGGPLLNDTGEVIGVTEGAIEGQNLNLAVPINYLKPLISFLKPSSIVPLSTFNAGSLKTAPAQPPEPKPKEASSSLDLDGAWSATISDTKGSASLQFNLVQNSQGDVVGTYTTSLGGGGQIKGVVKNSELIFELTQSIRDCAGIFKGTAKLATNKAAGTYTGTDCQGDHGNGTFTMTKGSSVPPPTPPPQSNIQIVDGNVRELRGVKYVFVFVENSLPTRNEITQRLNEGGLRTVTDSRLADLGLSLTIRYSQQGELVIADIAGEALRPNAPSGLRRVWTYNDRLIRRSMKEQDIAKSFVKAFLTMYRRMNTE